MEGEVSGESGTCFFASFFHGRGELAAAGEFDSDAAIVWVIGPCFGDDIAGSLQCSLFISDTEFRIFESGENGLSILGEVLLCEEDIGERL